MAKRYKEGCPKNDVYDLRRITVDVFHSLDRDNTSMVCFLFNEPCEIAELYRALEQHNKLNLKLIIEILETCGFYADAALIREELDKHEEFKWEDETHYLATKELLNKRGDALLTCKLFEFRIKLIEIQVQLSSEDIIQVKEHFKLTNNQKKDFPMFIDVIKLTERKLMDKYNPYKIVEQIQLCLRESLEKTGPIMKKLGGFYDLHCTLEKLNKIGNGMKNIGTIKLLSFLFNLKCGSIDNWPSLVSELKSEEVLNFHLLMKFLNLCGEYEKSAEVLEYATNFGFLENDMSLQNCIEKKLSASYGNLCQRSLEFRRLVVTFSLSMTFQNITSIRERFEFSREKELVCVNLLDVVLTTLEIKPKDLYTILLDALKFCNCESETHQLEEFCDKNRGLVDSCSTYKF